MIKKKQQQDETMRPHGEHGEKTGKGQQVMRPRTASTERGRTKH